jgi:predicted kinase
MEEAPENGKELSHSAHANGMNKWMEGQRRKTITNEKTHSARNSMQMLHKLYDIYMQVITYLAFKLPRTECTLLWKISKRKQCIQIMLIYWIIFKKNWRDVTNTLELDAADNVTSMSQTVNVSPIQCQYTCN